MVTSNQISRFFNIYRHKSPTLTQYHLIPSSTKLYWPSTTKYQPVPLSTYPVPLSTNQYCPVLTQHHNISTSPILYWPSTTKYQPVPPHTDPVPPSTNQYHLLLTKYQDFSVFLLLCENHISLFWILSSFSSSVYRPFSEKYFPSPYIFLLPLLCRPEMSTVVH